MGLKEAQRYLCSQENITCFRQHSSTATTVLLYIIFITGILLATFGNLIVIISISHFKNLYTPTNVLTLSLAVTDFLIGLCDMPVMMVKAVDECWYLHEIVCMALVFYHTALTSTSVTHLIFLAIDRYFAVCYPLIYMTKMTTRRAWLFAAISWLYPILYTIFICHYTFETLYSADHHCQGTCAINVYYTIQTVDLILAYILPLTVIIAAYSKIFFVAAEHARAIRLAKHAGKTLGKKQVKSVQNQHKATVTIGVLVSTFIVCVSPLYLCQFIEGYTGISTFVRSALQYFYLFNFAFNPIIYGLFYPWFRKALKIIATCNIFKTDSSLMNLFPQHF
ncbi:trace amine-associated receptor 13c-like [Erpetoichthys calabaricus]|uniref:trace amine-associated receptor 13c-like n=1 Tax=Erpetoichthys calabaricus TaxID=27687 RepID=UPI0022348AD8|nr:trace amine-associated receptor 13c-like [Erpetoichthys calabaricus]